MGKFIGSVALNDRMFRGPTLNLRQKQDFKINTELYDCPVLPPRSPINGATSAQMARVGPRCADGAHDGIKQARVAMRVDARDLEAR